MKYKEISLMNEESLKIKIEELNTELIKVNAEVATGTTIKNPMQIKEIKKTIARIKTSIKQKEIKKHE